ncbi:MAG: homocysteine S-methyltransferase family protein, partial [Armatimonadaceae bacterium]
MVPVFSDLLRSRILVLDGSMGVLLQRRVTTEEGYRGERFANHPRDLRNNTEALLLHSPHLVQEVHEAYLAAGADIVETSTFTANSVAQADYALEPYVREMNLVAARIARDACAKFSTSDRPRLVAGAMGPCNRSASVVIDADRPEIRGIDFEGLRRAYSEQAEALIDGGVDFLLCETTFDTLNLKAALFAIGELFERGVRNVPVVASLFIDQSGGNLSGQTVEAFWNSIRHFPLAAVGVNCSMGPDLLRPHVELLHRIADVPIIAYPNAGLPNPLSETGYDMGPEQMAPMLREWAELGWLNIVGGCCGTTPEHIKAIAAAVDGLAPRAIPDLPPTLRLAGTQPLTVREETNFINVGERCNVAGSSRFLKLIQEDRFEDALAVAREQVDNGAQILDVCFDDKGMLDRNRSMRHF